MYKHTQIRRYTGTPTSIHAYMDMCSHGQMDTDSSNMHLHMQIHMDTDAHGDTQRLYRQTHDTDVGIDPHKNILISPIFSPPRGPRPFSDLQPAVESSVTGVGGEVRPCRSTGSAASQTWVRLSANWLSDLCLVEPDFSPGTGVDEGYASFAGMGTSWERRLVGLASCPSGVTGTRSGISPAV